MRYDTTVDVNGQTIPIGRRVAYYRDRYRGRAGTNPLSPETITAIEALPGWTWESLDGRKRTVADTTSPLSKATTKRAPRGAIPRATITGHRHAAIGLHQRCAASGRTFCKVDKKPSEYESRAWADLGSFRTDRPVSRMAATTDRLVSNQTEKVLTWTRDLGDRHPRLGEAPRKISEQAKALAERVPTPVSRATGRAAVIGKRVAGGGAQLLGRLAVAGLRPQRVVRAHQRAGHPVTRLGDIRELDLQQVDEIKPSYVDLYYAFPAAAAGAGAGLMITGGALTIAVGTGATAAPTAGVIARSVAADAAAVLTLSSAVVGHHAMHYGYDPTRPEEKLFILSVVNWGTAGSSAAKSSAFADISRLTQALYRNKTWAELNRSAFASIASQFARRFHVRLIKRSLGKWTPLIGIAAGASLNWVTLERLADAADVAYRRRFLLDKYPHLADSGDPAANLGLDDSTATPATDDEAISIIDLIAEEDFQLPEPDADTETPTDSGEDSDS